MLPESLTGSLCRRVLLGRCADRIQMLLKCGRGQARSVRASLRRWLIGVNMELGVTFLDSDPSLSLSRSLSLLRSRSTPSILACCQVVSWCLCFMRPVETAWSSAGRRQAVRSTSGSLPHLHWAFNELFYSQGLDLKPQFTGTENQFSMSLSIRPAVRR